MNWLALAVFCESISLIALGVAHLIQGRAISALRRETFKLRRRLDNPDITYIE